jgi:hypothetical protein
MKRLLALLLLLPTLAFGDMQPISPAAAGTKTISCTNTTGATALPTAAVGMTQLEIQNTGTVDVYFEWGASTVTAAVATGYPVRPGQDKVVSIASTTTHVACIVSATTTTVYVTIGVGN